MALTPTKTMGDNTTATQEVAPTPSAGQMVPSQKVLDPVDPTQTSELTVAETVKAQKIAAAFNPRDAQAVVQYGNQSMADIANFSNTILDQTKVGDLDEIGAKVMSITTKAKSIDMSGLNKGGNFLGSLPIVGGLFNRMAKFKQKFESVKTEIDTVATELNVSQQKLLDRVKMLDTLYDKNTDQYRSLNMDIAAGEMVIEQYNTQIIPQMEANVGGDPLKAQELNDVKQAIHRFEKKVHDLKLTRISTLQTGPQIRIIQANNQTLAEKIQSTIGLTIPLWRKQFVLAVSLDEQKKAAELEKNVTDFTNDLLVSNSKLMKQNSLEIAKANERGVIDIETLESVQNDLLSTLDEVAQIQQEGKQKRQEASTRMVQLETEIKQRLTSPGATTTKAA